MRVGAARRGGASDSYFISLNDLLVGVLFIFIVLLMTYALMFQDAVDKLKEQLTQRTEVRTALLERLERKLHDAGFKAVKAVPEDGVLRLTEEVLFDPGQAVLGGRAKAALTVIGRELATELPCYGAGYRNHRCRSDATPLFEAVYVEGHTDDIPINNARFNSNWELSSTRAIVTYKHLLQVNSGLDKLPNGSGTAALLGASAYADTRPVRSRANRDENRRIDLRFLLTPATEREVQSAATKAKQ